MEVLSDVRDPRTRQSGLNWLFWYEDNVAVCLSVHTCMHLNIYTYTCMRIYICKRREKQRQKTDSE